MSKIKLITDTTSDIPSALAKELGIEIKNIPIAIDGTGYLEGVDFSNEEFYERLLAAKEIPATSRINCAEYLESFTRAAAEGYTDLICVTINGKGSGTLESAHLAREQFLRDEPVLAAGMKITIIDSKSYSLGYGYPVMEAAKMIAAGEAPGEIIAYIQDWADSAEIFLACYTLDFAKKSGRISSAAAFVGELLGLRPIIHMVDGGNNVLEKVRGDKNVVPRVCALCQKAIAAGGEYIIVRGMLDEPAEELSALLEEKLGYPPKGVYTIGASVSINAGPRIIAVVVRGQKRPQ
ncbi:DegV family protein [Harryflintia acetispora]|uniref:DegV family protein with EDD domain n=1 Tax=Harryflintia acetispora TaxID=1849041 RepID=A0A9X8UI53_9FIRM|nr:DegV family protein [Harryflintia acetispora]TCL42618.1 DegV family protein with EDD domain [Harryflintia acetispora]